jgi:hypothetical protein
VHRSLGATARSGALLATLSWLLVACGSVKVRPEQQLPKALMQPLAAHAGLVLNEELRSYRHQETRSGGDWEIDLGPGHEKLLRSMFEASFAELQVFTNPDAARAATGVQALFVPHIEQYSFATASETSGAYWAVTIRYRVNVQTPQGEPVDSLTLTGYGSAMGAGRAAASLVEATRVAMRDAAAKFLVQMPRLALAKKLVAGQALSAADARSAVVDIIEAVPIDAPPPSS